MNDLVKEFTDTTQEMNRGVNDLGGVLQRRFTSGAALELLREKTLDSTPAGWEQQQNTQLEQTVKLQSWADKLLGQSMLGRDNAVGYLKDSPFPVVDGTDMSDVAQAFEEVKNSDFSVGDTVVEFDGLIGNLLEGVFSVIGVVLEGLLGVFGITFRSRDNTDAAKNGIDTQQNPSGGTDTPNKPVDTDDMSGLEKYEGVAAEALKLIFTRDVIANWQNMSMNDRAQYVVAYTKYLNEALGLHLQTLGIEDLGDTTFGLHQGNSIVVNSRLLDNGDLGELGKLIQNITHEMRHQFQMEAVNNPSAFDVPVQIINQWMHGFNNYINPEDSLEGYSKQPLEQDARDFADKVMQRAGLGGLPIDYYTLS